MMFGDVFKGMVLPVKPVMAANGATIQLIEEQPLVAAAAPFFGGYAEDMLADIGFEAVDDQPRAELRARKA